MKQTIILLLALLIATTNEGPRNIITQFSIYTFLNYLHENDYYDLIYWAKCSYGDDIAIGLCEDLVSSVFCESTARIYMPECPVSEAPPVNYAQEYFYQPNNLKILRKDFTMAEINKIVKKFELRVEKELNKRKEYQKELQEPIK